MIDWARSRVLVTGGTGFLGHHLVEKLRDRQCAELTVVGSKDADLTREAEVDRLFEHTKPHLVFHMAGLVGGILPNATRPAEFFYQNLMMGTLVLHQAWKHGATKLVAAGAGCGYPEFAETPLKEESLWDGRPQKESAPYSLAKRLLTVQSDAYQRQYGFVSIIGIPGNLYGEWDNFSLSDGHVIPALVRKFVEATASGDPSIDVWGTGEATRDFVYAGDVAEALITASEVYDRSEVVNLSSGTETSVAEVCALLRAITGYSGAIAWDRSRPNGQSRRRFDVSKAERELGFRARTTLREGLERTVGWYEREVALEAVAVRR